MTSRIEVLSPVGERKVSELKLSAGLPSLEGRVMVSARRFGELGVSTAGELNELGTIDRAARALQPGTMPVATDDVDAVPEYLTADA